MQQQENVLFEDVFDIQKRDPDGKKFDKGELGLCGCRGA